MTHLFVVHLLLHRLHKVVAQSIVVNASSQRLNEILVKFVISIEGRVVSFEHMLLLILRAALGTIHESLVSL